MNEQQIRAMIRQEIATAGNGARFGINSTGSHAHTGVDSPQVSQSNILPGLRAEGSITFAQQTVYKIGLTFNPTAIQVHGNVVGTHGNERFMIVGNAQLGPSYYMQPGTSTSVITGGPQQSLIQSTTYYGTDLSANPHTVVSEGHIIDVTYSSTIFLRATVTSFDAKAIYITVNTLSSGWSANISWTVT